MVLVCHMILQGHVIKASCDFMSESSSWQVTTLPTLVTTGIDGRDMMFSVVEEQDSTYSR